jgi:hypothetical protein
MYLDPAQLQTLQEVFDAIWMELQRDNDFRSLTDQKSLREEIARGVIDHAKVDMPGDAIIDVVLEQIELKCRHVRWRTA